MRRVDGLVSSQPSIRTQSDHSTHGGADLGGRPRFRRPLQPVRPWRVFPADSPKCPGGVWSGLPFDRLRERSWLPVEPSGTFLAPRGAGSGAARLRSARSRSAAGVEPARCVADLGAVGRRYATEIAAGLRRVDSLGGSQAKIRAQSDHSKECLRSQRRTGGRPRFRRPLQPLRPWRVFPAVRPNREGGAPAYLALRQAQGTKQAAALTSPNRDATPQLQDHQRQRNSNLRIAGPTVPGRVPGAATVNVLLWLHGVDGI